MRPCAVFDLDGTLVDSVPLFTVIINAMLAERGADHRIAESQARPHATAGGYAMVSALLGDYCGEVDAAVADFRHRYASTPTPADSLYPGVRETLLRLETIGIATAVWTNKPQNLCDKVLADLGISSLFASAVGTTDLVPLKPDTTGLDFALAMAGSDRTTSCFIGDSDLDYQAAKQAGIPFVMVAYGYGDYSCLRPGAILVDDLGGVVPVVARLLAVPA